MGLREPPTGENVISFKFRVRLFDHIDLTDHSSFNISGTLSWSGGSPVDCIDFGTKDREITYTQNENDNAVFDWDVSVIDQPQRIYQE